MAEPPSSLAAQLTVQGAQKIPAASPFLAVRRGARQLFDKMRSKPRAAAALPFDLHSPRRVSSLSCSLRSPIRDAVETLGEKHPAALAIIIFLCSEKY
ncbi:hypothetical protein Zm00014a_017218 [Zea mays]|jgi:hypothetical protein|nr:hypothetical protein Zm00014a_017218 [Zea mays]